MILSAIIVFLAFSGILIYHFGWKTGSIIIAAIVVALGIAGGFIGFLL